jgi:biotin carboxyl carrier protein
MMAERVQHLATKSDLNQLGKELGAKINENTEKLEENSKEFDVDSPMVDRVYRQVVENGEGLGQLLVMTEEFKGFFHEIITSLDVLTSGFATMNDEQVAMNARLDRIEKDVQELKAR